jgi:hypothetical protein
MWQQWNVFRRQESEVAKSLKSLPSEYVLLHDLIVPESQALVDHVVVGPNGLFAIETRDCAGDVKCEGREWFVDRRRVASLGGRPAIKAAALRDSLVSMTYGGENKIPRVTPVLVFTNAAARVSVRNPAVPAMRVEELAAFILHYKIAEISQKDQAALLGHLVSFQSRHKARRLSFLGLRIGRARAPKRSGAPAARRVRSGLKIASKSAGDEHQSVRHSVDRFPDFSGSN